MCGGGQPQKAWPVVVVVVLLRAVVDVVLLAGCVWSTVFLFRTLGVYINVLASNGQRALSS